MCSAEVAKKAILAHFPQNSLQEHADSAANNGGVSAEETAIQS
jgi:hypothetical protein